MKISDSKEGEKIIEKKGLILFTANGCIDCRNFAPHFQKIVREYSNLPIYHVNIDELPKLAHIAEVRSIPILGLYEKGKQVSRLTDYSEKGLRIFIQKHFF